MAIAKVLDSGTANQGLISILQYVLQPHKTTRKLVDIHGPYDDIDISPERVYDAFIQEKRLWKKNTGRSYSQIIISFHPEEKITYEQVLEFGNDFVRRMYPEHQALVVVHYDRDH